MVPPRKVLVVAGAAGHESAISEVFQRFNFLPALTAPSVADALSRLREEHFDLMVLPLQELGPVELTAVDREIRRGSLLAIATAPQLDPDLMLRAMRSGIQELVLYPPDPKELAGAIDRLLRRTTVETTKGTCIAVYSGKGGLGTTTVATNLAYALARGHPSSRVALADFVVNDGDVSIQLDLKSEYTIEHLLEKMSRVDADLLYSLLTPFEGGVWVLPAGESPELLDAVDAAAATAIISHLRTHFAYTVIDCEHHLTDRTLAAFDAADKILLLTQLNVAALRSTQRTIALCQRLGYEDEKILVVTNRFQSSDVVTLNDATRVLERDIYFSIPNDYKTAAAAVTKGVPIAALDASSKLAQAYKSLAAKLGGAASPTAGSNGHRPGALSRLFARVRK